MLTIRRDQRAVLARVHEDAFEERLAAHLRRHFPDESARMGPALEARVKATIAYGREHGLVSERDLARYAGVIVANEVDYEGTPEPEWMRKIIDDPTQPDPGQRADRLAHASIQRFLVEARAFEDRKAYYGG